jgi:hypothetical protein
MQAPEHCCIMCVCLNTCLWYGMQILLPSESLGGVHACDFCVYVLSCKFLRYLSSGMAHSGFEV